MINNIIIYTACRILFQSMKNKAIFSYNFI
nr:MAG TPA: hypothetical protein [Crassvirales sp.]